MKKLTIITTILLMSLIAHSQWTTKEDLSTTARNHPVTFSIDGLGYVFTGYNTLAGQIFNNGLSYNPETDSWTTLSSFPGGYRGFAVGASYEGKGYLGFGVNSSGFLKDLWEYDPVNDSWTQLTPCPCLARRHPAFSITSNGKIYVGLGNGIDAQGNADPGFKDWWEYDISSDTWTQMPDLPAAGRHHPYFFAVGTDAYVGFGDNHVNIFNDFYKFNSLTGQWTVLNNFPGEARVAGAQFSYGGYGYIVDGEGQDHQNLNDGEFYRYDPASDTWKTLASHTGDGLWAPGAFVIDSMAYVTGGDNNFNASQTTLWTFSLEKNPVDKAISSVGSVYTLNEDFYDEGASFQWIDCNDNDSEVAGETSSSVDVPEGGSYALVVTYSNGGIDTSGCYLGSPLGISDGTFEMNNSFQIYPNPSSAGKVHLKNLTSLEIKVGIFNSLGQQIRILYIPSSSTIEISDLPQGLLLFKNKFNQDNFVSKPLLMLK